MATREVLRGESAIVLASAARTATPTIDTFRVVGGAQGLLVTIDATAAAATPSVVFTILGVDPVSAKTWTVLASAAVTGIATTVLRVSPHLTGSTNLIAKDVIPAYFTITAVHADSDSLTYSLGVQVS